MSMLQLRRWTRQEYDRMIEAGVLTPDDHVELIEGEILAMTPQGSPHATAVWLALDALGGVFRQPSHVRVQLPLALGSDSEPEPDVAVVSGTARDYRSGHPQTALLLVEIADASVAYDREVKGGLYARAGIPEYWLVNLIDGCVEVYRDPVAVQNTRFGWAYRTQTRFGKNEHLSPIANPSSRIAVADILP